eukprot:scaffold20864_cov72-Phaeocystis_antarctica.AAC.10
MELRAARLPRRLSDFRLVQPRKVFAGRLPRFPDRRETTKSFGRQKQRFTAASSAARNSACAAARHAEQAAAKLARQSSSSSSATRQSRSTEREVRTGASAFILARNNS